MSEEEDIIDYSDEEFKLAPQTGSVLDDTLDDEGGDGEEGELFSEQEGSAEPNLGGSAMEFEVDRGRTGTNTVASDPLMPGTTSGAGDAAQPQSELLGSVQDTSTEANRQTVYEDSEPDTVPRTTGKSESDKAKGRGRKHKVTRNAYVSPADEICGNPDCNTLGHRVQDCTAVNLEGVTRGCPFCNGSHMCHECPKISKLQKSDWYHFLVVRRNGRPPIRAVVDFREIDPARFANDHRRPQTREYALERAKARGRVQTHGHVVQDPVWSLPDPSAAISGQAFDEAPVGFSIPDKRPSGQAPVEQKQQTGEIGEANSADKKAEKVTPDKDINMTDTGNVGPSSSGTAGAPTGPRAGGGRGRGHGRGGGFNPGMQGGRGGRGGRGGGFNSGMRGGRGQYGNANSTSNSLFNGFPDRRFDNQLSHLTPAAMGYRPTFTEMPPDMLHYFAHHPEMMSDLQNIGVMWGPGRHSARQQIPMPSTWNSGGRGTHSGAAFGPRGGSFAGSHHGPLASQSTPLGHVVPEDESVTADPSKGGKADNGAAPSKTDRQKKREKQKLRKRMRQAELESGKGENGIMDDVLDATTGDGN